MQRLLPKNPYQAMEVLVQVISQPWEVPQSAGVGEGR